MDTHTIVLPSVLTAGSRPQVQPVELALDVAGDACAHTTLLFESRLPPGADTSSIRTVWCLVNLCDFPLGFVVVHVDEKARARSPFTQDRIELFSAYRPGPAPKTVWLVVVQVRRSR